MECCLIIVIIIIITIDHSGYLDACGKINIKVDLEEIRRDLECINLTEDKHH
jgi:hypothetical protein